VDSREQALAAVAAGRVRVAGSDVVKASTLVAPDQSIELVGEPPRFVGRGGEKLDAALDRFGLDVRGRRALDAGASTGGFSDCLLRRGAGAVVAVDVGKGQLHARVRDDPRVEVRDATNVRHLGLDDVGGAPFDVIVADLSFISLRTVAPVLAGELAAPGSDVVALVKPQFEVGRREASRGRGVIRDPALWLQAVEGVCDAFGQAGAAMIDVMVSPLRGADGNVEFMVHGRAHSAGTGGAGTQAGAGPDIDGAVQEAAAMAGPLGAAAPTSATAKGNGD